MKINYLKYTRPCNPKMIQIDGEKVRANWQSVVPIHNKQMFGMDAPSLLWPASPRYVFFIIATTISSDNRNALFVTVPNIDWIVDFFFYN